MWQLRAALEEKQGPVSASECATLAASEWMIHSGMMLYRMACGTPLPEDPYPVATGALFNGKPGLNPERWGFWKTQFVQLAEDDGRLCSEVRAVACSAAKSMIRAEEHAPPRLG